MDKPVALITGASQGLGRALAEALSAQGWRLVIDARHADRLDAAAAVVRASSEVVPVAGDVANPLPPLDSIDLDALRTTYEVNVVAPLALVQALLPLLAASKGTIINITSDAAVEAYEGWGGYGSSKAALEHLSAVLAAEHPELRVRWVDPGDMRTEMHQDAFPGEDISDRPLPESVVPQLVALIGTHEPSGR